MVISRRARSLNYEHLIIETIFYTRFPALIVSPLASDSVKIDTKEEFLIRSFKDGRYYTVSKKDTKIFHKDSGRKYDRDTMKEGESFLKGPKFHNFYLMIQLKSCGQSGRLFGPRGTSFSLGS